MKPGGWYWMTRSLEKPLSGESASIPDRELIARFVRDRDAAAFELLVWRHGAMVFGVCRRGIRDHQLAEDAFQATFMILAQKAGSIRGANLAGWLFRVARRVTARARNRFEPATQIRDRASPESSSDFAHHELLDAEIARLPARLRLPVLMCYFDGRSTEDVARELGCPRGTILSRLSTARARLAERLSRRGVALPAGALASTDVVDRRLLAAVTQRIADTSSRQMRGVAFTLKTGVLRAMAVRKITTAFSASFLAAASTLGLGFAISRGSDPVLEAAQIPAKEDAVKAQPKTTQPPTSPETQVAQQRQQRDERLRKLEKMAEALRAEIRAREAQIKLLTETAGPSTADIDEKIRAYQRGMEFERELLLDDIRDAARRLRESRTELAVVQETKGGNDPAVIEPRAKLKVAEKQVADARGRLRTLEEVVGDQLTKLRREREKMMQTTADRDGLLKDIEPMRTALGQIEMQLLSLRTDADIPQSVGVEAKLDKLIHEVETLRKDVQELKKK